jgi:hypothetical protein
MTIANRDALKATILELWKARDPMLREILLEVLQEKKLQIDLKKVDLLIEEDMDAYDEVFKALA